MIERAVFHVSVEEMLCINRNGSKTDETERKARGEQSSDG